MSLIPPGFVSLRERERERERIESSYDFSAPFDPPAPVRAAVLSVPSSLAHSYLDAIAFLVHEGFTLCTTTSHGPHGDVICHHLTHPGHKTIRNIMTDAAKQLLAAYQLVATDDHLFAFRGAWSDPRKIPPEPSASQGCYACDTTQCKRYSLEQRKTLWRRIKRLEVIKVIHLA